MPYPMVHLKIAYELFKRYDGEYIERPGDFLLGSVAAERDLSFMAGTHLLTDWENDRRIWTPFREIEKN